MLETFGSIKAFEPIILNNAMAHCFVEFSNHEAAEQCILKLNNQKIKTRTVTVKRAISAKEPQQKAPVSSVNRARPKSSLFEKDPHSFYLTFDTNGFFRDMKISCVLLLRNIMNSQGDR